MSYVPFSNLRTTNTHIFVQTCVYIHENVGITFLCVYMWIYTLESAQKRICPDVTVMKKLFESFFSPHMNGAFAKSSNYTYHSRARRTRSAIGNTECIQYKLYIYMNKATCDVYLCVHERSNIKKRVAYSMVDSWWRFDVNDGIRIWEYPEIKTFQHSATSLLDTIAALTYHSA